MNDSASTGTWDEIARETRSGTNCAAAIRTVVTSHVGAKALNRAAVTFQSLEQVAAPGC